MAVSDVLPIDPSFPVSETILQKVLTSDPDSGQEQRKLKWQNPKRLFKIRTDNMTNAEMDTLRAFFVARKLAFDVFSFLPPKNMDRLVTVLACGTGNGSTTVFNIGNSATPPYYYRLFTGAGTRNQAYKDGVASAATFANNDAGTISTVTFSVAPANGVVITADIDRYLIMRLVNAKNEMTLEHYGIGSVQDYEMIEVLRSSI